MLVALRVSEIGEEGDVLRETVPLKPKMLVRLMIDWAVPPCLMVSESGLALIRKSGPVTLTGM